MDARRLHWRVFVDIRALVLGLRWRSQPGLVEIWLNLLPCLTVYVRWWT